MTTSEIAVTMSSPNFDFSQNLDYSIEEDISGWTGKDWTNFIQENLDAFYSENFSPKIIFTIKELSENGKETQMIHEIEAKLPAVDLSEIEFLSIKTLGKR